MEIRHQYRSRETAITTPADADQQLVRVNQLGYLPGAAKWALLCSNERHPLPVQLERSGKVLWRGGSVPRGRDLASGDAVHQIDFSEFRGSSEDLVLRVGDASSLPFRIDDSIYETLPVDALKYFYHNRCSVPIARPFVSKGEYERPAGHISDSEVPSAPGGPNYRLDVRGGWYDAGDHGKYVVNGGISAWTLLALFERMRHLSGAVENWGDGTLNIPESGNGVPDILDEARVEVEFLLRMQVPEGEELAGMAHHKVHDRVWPPLAVRPPEESNARELHPPSTAATLNLAAVAAQASRIWRPFSPGFSERCLVAARRAYVAASKHPDHLAPFEATEGGGAYGDDDVSDEFFWAAAELFITTGDSGYRAALEASDHFLNFPTRVRREDDAMDGPWVGSSMNWQLTSALGWISLANVPNLLPREERARLRAEIIGVADLYLSVIENEGYRLPLEAGEDAKYPWGSNSFVLNNMIVLSLGYDYTGDRKYADGVVQGMDYLLGRNPMEQSYITGYGAKPVTQPHHRFWARAIDPSFPEPPPGAVSGGPNSGLQDSHVKSSGLDESLPPQKCFVDHIDAWSVNEIAINWNAALVWNAVFLNEWRGKVASIGQ